MSGSLAEGRRGGPILGIQHARTLRKSAGAPVAPVRLAGKTEGWPWVRSAGMGSEGRDLPGPRKLDRIMGNSSKRRPRRRASTLTVGNPGEICSILKYMLCRSTRIDGAMPITSLIAQPERLYVIGDIHGRADLLERMIDQVHRDLGKDPIENCLTVTVGDYIDRGLKSRDVLDRLTCKPFPTAFIPLKGNHEDLFEAFLRDPSIGDLWRRFGGLETLHSYGVDVGPLMRGKNYEAAAEALMSAVPQAHFDFLASLDTALIAGRYFLCHAGVCPGVPLLEQREEDLLWIRERFLNSNADFGKIVVHGHTPVQRPEILPNRINIDTGAFMTGRLTCVVLEEGRTRFLTAV